MTPRSWIPVALALSLCACTQADSPSATAGAATAAAPAATAAAPAATAAVPAATTEGSIDFAITASTVDSNSKGDANSVQCQLNFKASNHSKAAVKSVIAEFSIAKASDGSVVETESTLTMPFEIPPDETRDAWGPIIVNDHRCADLNVTVKAHTVGMCQTKDKSPCPAYHLSGEGLASAH